MPTVAPVTVRPYAPRGRVLSFAQDGITRYACLHLPRQAQDPDGHDRKWPLVVYLHGSRTTPESLYTLGRHLFDFHDTHVLSDDPDVRGFVLLAPEGRRAAPWSSPTGTGFHWDEWHHSPSSNLDALAIDRFIDETIATGRVDPRRIYVFGWSNGAYMAALYGVWRGERIAAIGQYAGGDPWTRPPCPVPMTYTRRVPLVLLRNLCDALVPCKDTSAWIQTLTSMGWPFAYHDLDLHGRITSPGRTCDERCSKPKGLYAHVRWPKPAALEVLLQFFREHPLA